MWLRKKKVREIQTDQFTMMCLASFPSLGFWRWLCFWFLRTALWLCLNCNCLTESKKISEPHTPALLFLRFRGTKPSSSSSESASSGNNSTLDAGPDRRLENLSVDLLARFRLCRLQSNWQWKCGCQLWPKRPLSGASPAAAAPLGGP